MAASHAWGGSVGDAYSMLGVSGRSSLGDVKRAFRKKALQMHPDRVQAGDAEGFLMLKDAYECILEAAEQGLEHDGADAAPPAGQAESSAASDEYETSLWKTGGVEDTLLGSGGSGNSLAALLRKSSGRQRHLRPLACSLGSFGLRPGSGCRQSASRTPFHSRGQALELPSSYINGRKTTARRGSARTRSPSPALPTAAAADPRDWSTGPGVPPLPQTTAAHRTSFATPEPKRRPGAPPRQRSASPARPADSSCDWSAPLRAASTPPLPTGVRPPTAGAPTRASVSRPPSAAHTSAFVKKKRIPAPSSLAYASWF
eukprot:TRINITY_DN20097_c0_g1_i1.p1 TRINITY_DN20097_c0_g1~~TRINITY_DN20097_c0_g1_i1.p1  ORF type:complete len:315 (+),score=36.55 TRINITY_DN20097_c0_g1_i1:187-1131(+)